VGTNKLEYKRKKERKKERKKNKLQICWQPFAYVNDLRL
jgi:hypothetical protein